MCQTEKIITLTELQKELGFYTLPGVNRPINPRDPLGLWDVYHTERELNQQQNEERKTPQEDQSYSVIALFIISKEKQQVQ